MKRTEAVGEWKMVPVEPTQEMLQAAQQEEWRGINAELGTTGFPMYRKFYRAMLSAAPQPTEQETTKRLQEDSWGIIVRWAIDLERQLSEALEREKALEDALQVAVDSELGAKWIWPDSAKETWMKNARELLSSDEPTYTDCPIHGRHEGDCPRC